MTQPGVVFGQSDAGAHVAQLCDANMPTELLAHWVRDKGAFTPWSGPSTSSRPSWPTYSGSRPRPPVPGAAADVVVFDLDTARPRARCAGYATSRATRSA